MLLILCEITINEAKNDQRVPRMICGKSRFFQLAFIFLFLLTIHTKHPGGNLVVGERPATKYIQTN